MPLKPEFLKNRYGQKSNLCRNIFRETISTYESIKVHVQISINMSIQVCRSVTLNTYVPLCKL